MNNKHFDSNNKDIERFNKSDLEYVLNKEDFINLVDNLFNCYSNDLSAVFYHNMMMVDNNKNNTECDYYKKIATSIYNTYKNNSNNGEPTSFHGDFLSKLIVGLNKKETWAIVRTISIAIRIFNLIASNKDLNEKIDDKIDKTLMDILNRYITDIYHV